MPETVASSIRDATRVATILVVDDTEANRYVVVRHLKGAGFRTIEAANGTDGLRLAIEERPNLVILDVRMPDFSGFELARRLRADERTAAIPILHISASFTDVESRAQGLDNGADGYLTHPVEPSIMLATVRSLLGAREAERQAIATARAWRATFDAIAEGVCVTDRDGAIVRCNEAFTDIVGLPYDRLIGQRVDAVMPGVRVLGEPPYVGFPEDAELGELFQFRSRWLRASAVPLADAAGLSQGAVSVFADVTRQRTADERLRQAQQLEVTGRLAGGVAHEINNMMTIILGYSNFVLQRMVAGDPSRADLEQVHRAATRAAEIARQLLTFSRRQPFRPAVVELGTLVRQTERTLRQLMGADREVRIQTARQPVWVKVDPGHLEQVLVNLTLNARDAMPDGGVLRLTLDRLEVGAPDADGFGAVEIGSGSYARLRVSDTGRGMDADTLAHVFEPFFTTKDVGSGTGLGLATVYGIVRQADGYITAESQPGRGSMFTILLPAVAASERATPLGEPQDHDPRFGRETVLVVEDEPAVLALARRTLEHFGYSVIDATNGIEALERLDETGADVRLILTDVVMPRMGGGAFAAAAREKFPGLPVLFMSGYTNDEIEHRQLLPSGEHFIAKPFDPETLATKVRDLLGPTAENGGGALENTVVSG